MTERIPVEILSFYLIFCFSKLHAIACLNGLQCTSVCVCVRAYMFVCLRFQKNVSWNESKCTEKKLYYNISWTSHLLFCSITKAVPSNMTWQWPVNHQIAQIRIFPFFFLLFFGGVGGGGIPWTNMGQEQVKYAQTSNIKIELSALYRIQIKFASMSRVETPQTENDSSNDYKQFKLQEAKQQDLHYVYERERESAHTHTRIHTHTAQHSTAHS